MINKFGISNIVEINRKECTTSIALKVKKTKSEGIVLKNISYQTQSHMHLNAIKL